MIEPADASRTSAPLVTPPAGPVRGHAASGCSQFLGIPYAFPPVGDLRFAAPQSVPRWDGVLDTSEFGPPPPRFSTLGPAAVSPHRGGEDWLTLNIWTPELPEAESATAATPDAEVAGAVASEARAEGTASGRAGTSAAGAAGASVSRAAGASTTGAAGATAGPGLPVLVWIHGGAYVDGSSAHPAYEGSRLARAGAVVVTLNYRLGIEGFAHFPDAPANRGLLDQVAALEWVRENIAAFGGDPARVTVFGESAGAGSIHMLLTMPAARGLFARAVLQSPPAMVLDAGLATEVTAEFAGLAGVEPTAAGFAALSPAECTDLMARFVRGQTRHAARWGLAVTFAPPLCPVVDGEVVPTDPWEALRAGAAAGIEVLIGQTTEEFRFFTAGSAPASEARAAQRVALVGPAGRGEEYTALLGGAGAESGAGAGIGAGPGAGSGAGEGAAAEPPADASAEPGVPAAEGPSPDTLFEAVQTDRMFTVPTLDAAQAHSDSGGRTFVYVFAARPDGGIGAAHAADIAPLFGNFDGSFAAVTHPRPHDGDRHLGAEMRQAWVRFAASGDPGWPAWDSTHPVRVFDYTSRTDTHPFIDRWRLFADDPARPLGLREA
ncbi:para-nitrobenzyl esterase [Brevibacterium pityocampae]